MVEVGSADGVFAEKLDYWVHGKGTELETGPALVHRPRRARVVAGLRGMAGHTNPLARATRRQRWGSGPVWPRFKSRYGEDVFQAGIPSRMANRHPSTPIMSATVFAPGQCQVGKMSSEG